MNHYSVLVVEDNAASRLLLQQQIASLEAQCVAAASVKEAIEQLDQNSINLIFMDLHLGVGEDLSLLAQYLEGYRPRPTIMGITATLDEEAEKVCKLLNVDEILSKPIQTEILNGILRGSYLRTILNEEIPDQNEQLLMDQRRLDEMRSLAEHSGADSVRKVFDSFDQNSRQRVLGLWQAVTSKDLVSIQHICHSWRGIAASLGAAQLSDALIAMENCKSDDFTIRINLFNNIKQTYLQSSRALNAFLSELAG